MKKIYLIKKVLFIFIVLFITSLTVRKLSHSGVSVTRLQRAIKKYFWYNFQQENKRPNRTFDDQNFKQRWCNGKFSYGCLVQKVFKDMKESEITSTLKESDYTSPIMFVSLVNKEKQVQYMPGPLLRSLLSSLL